MALLNFKTSLIGCKFLTSGLNKGREKERISYKVLYAVKEWMKTESSWLDTNKINVRCPQHLKIVDTPKPRIEFRGYKMGGAYGSEGWSMKVLRVRN